MINVFNHCFSAKQRGLYMFDKKKKILVTSALPYVNNVPHLGNLVGAVLSADVFARFSRLSGFETLFVCGSDEHGTATETKAKQEGISPKELCDKYYSLHKKIYDWFNISFDIFGRTSEKNHEKITRDIFNKVLENGFISEDVVVQPYSESSKMFLADRFVTGTCPYCGFEKARGDQCDSCGKLLNPQDLIDPKSAIDGSKPVFKETNHLFLHLDKLQPYLESWVKKQSSEGSWSANAIRTTNAWFKEGLKKRAITRDLKWGINIPETAFDGRFKDKVFYVWFDAPIGYISITEQLLGDSYKYWWLNPDNVQLVQFMGKDNIPFHSIIFPATLLATNKNLSVDDPRSDFTLVNHINATEYLNYEHTKFSKSNQIGVFGDNAKDSGVPADVFRYVLMFYRPENSDTQFTWKGLQERLNNELVANFGNFVNRTISFTNRFLDNKVFNLTKPDLTSEENSFYEKYSEEVKEFIRLMSHVKLRDALNQFMKISSLGNQYFQESEPWKTRTTNRNKCERDLSLLINMVKDLAIMIQPYMPQTAENIFNQLNIKPRNFDDLLKLDLADLTINKASILFQKVDDDKIAELKELYSGKQVGSGTSLNNSAGGGSKKSTSKHKNESSTSKNVDKLKPCDLDLRVGKIVSIEKHPKADKLYVEKIDLGFDEPVEIVSGLVPYYSVDELLGKNVIVVANLKPAKLRGVLSNGMLLAAEDSSGVVGLVLAPQAKPGDSIVFKDSCSPKEEITFEEFLTLSLKAEDGTILINNSRISLSDSDLVIDKDIKNGNVS